MNQKYQKLFDKELLNDKQQEIIKNYFSLGIFSVRNELLFLMYVSVLLFSSGVGILIYKNIDTIGHDIILSTLLALVVACYFFSFKKSSGFSKKDIDFPNPIYNYLVLLSTILSCSFMGYFQYQYNLFGSHFEISILVSAFIALATAYYFNNKSALSIGLTALTTSIGISLTPRTLIENDVYLNENLSFYGLILGALLIAWAIFSEKIDLKKHFDLILVTFSLHLSSICCIAGLINDLWFIFIFLLTGSIYYFYKKSFEIPSLAIYVFVLLYAYIGFNICFIRLFDVVDFLVPWELLVLFFPIYFIFSILLFIKAIKKFNKNKHDSL